MIWLLFIPGIIITVYVIFEFYVGYGSPAWPQTGGKVIYSGVIVKTNTASSSKNKHYHPKVNYEYTVDSVTYHSNKIGNYLGFGNDRQFAEDIVKDYPGNSEIRVFYSPFFHRISVLRPGMKQLLAHCLLLFVGIIITLASAPALFSDNPSWFADKIWKLVDLII